MWKKNLNAASKLSGVSCKCQDVSVGLLCRPIPFLCELYNIRVRSLSWLRFDLEFQHSVSYNYRFYRARKQTVAYKVHLNHLNLELSMFGAYRFCTCFKLVLSASSSSRIKSCVPYVQAITPAKALLLQHSKRRHL